MNNFGVEQRSTVIYRRQSRHINYSLLIIHYSLINEAMLKKDLIFRDVYDIIFEHVISLGPYQVGSLPKIRH